MSPSELPDLLRAAVARLAPVIPVGQELGRRFAEAGHELALVGGPVRDAFIGRTSPDLDFTTDATPDETARELAAGGRLVVLTRGSRGSTAYSGTAEPVSVPAVPVEVVNTIGAGDAFMAAMITWMVSLGVHPGGVREFTPSSVEEMLVFASRVAASVVAQAGTEPSLPVDA